MNECQHWWTEETYNIEKLTRSHKEVSLPEINEFDDADDDVSD